VVKIRVGSFNLLSGRSLEDGEIEPSRLTAAIRELDADVLAVQEVDRFQPRSAFADQAQAVAAAMDAVSGRFVATVDGTPGEPGWTAATWWSDFDGCSPTSPDGSGGFGAGLRPDYGIGLYSRLPVADWAVLRLRPARGRFPLALPTRPMRVLWLPDEPRAAVAAVLAEPRLTVACAHLSFVPGVNAAHLLRVRRWLARLPAPRLLVGDLNMPAAPARRLTGWTPLVRAPTFPSPAPKMQLDHVLASGLPAGTRATGHVLHLPLSDHRAVRVDLDLP
jgi:endonuclease/exonuclease/phosphatase family metal-dependent hydrolase